MRLRLLALALGVSLGSGVLPAAAAAQCTGLPKHRKLPVVDAANVIPQGEEAYLVTDLLRHHISGHEAIVAVTVPDLGGDDVSSYAKRLFDCWGIGDAQADNGILILLAMAEKRVRIEAGAGLEGRLTEAQLEAAIDEMVAPLREGDIAGGLRAAAEAVARELGGELPDTQAGRHGTAVPTAVPSRAPGDVDDSTPGEEADGFPVNMLPGGPLDPVGDSGAGAFAALVPLVIVVGVIGSVVRAVVRGAGSGSAWRGGFPSIGGSNLGWQHPAVLRGGAWHVAGAPSSGMVESSSPWSGGSAFDDDDDSFGGSFGGSSGSGSSGSSGGSSFGGGSSGGGGASGSW